MTPETGSFRPGPSLPVLPVPDGKGLIHATTISVSGGAALIIGPSGSGKSDLALRMIDRGAILVSDDYTHIGVDGDSDTLIASPPASIAGRMEVRGLGLVDMPFLPRAPLVMVVALIGQDDAPPARYPLAPLTHEILAIRLPLLPLNPFEGSAVIKLELSIKGAITGSLFVEDRGYDER